MDEDRSSLNVYSGNLKNFIMIVIGSLLATLF
jgi:hypothetical protein